MIWLGRSSPNNIQDVIWVQKLCIKSFPGYSLAEGIAWLLQGNTWFSNFLLNPATPNNIIEGGGNLMLYLRHKHEHKVRFNFLAQNHLTKASRRFTKLPSLIRRLISKARDFYSIQYVKNCNSFQTYNFLF